MTTLDLRLPVRSAVVRYWKGDPPERSEMLAELATTAEWADDSLKVGDVPPFTMPETCIIWIELVLLDEGGGELLWIDVTSPSARWDNTQ